MPEKSSGPHPQGQRPNKVIKQTQWVPVAQPVFQICVDAPQISFAGSVGGSPASVDEKRLRNNSQLHVASPLDVDGEACLSIAASEEVLLGRHVRRGSVDELGAKEMGAKGYRKTTSLGSLHKVCRDETDNKSQSPSGTPRRLQHAVSLQRGSGEIDDFDVSQDRRSTGNGPHEGNDTLLSLSTYENIRQISVAQEMARDVNFGLSLRANERYSVSGGGFHTPLSSAGISSSPKSIASFSPITPVDWRMTHPTHINTLLDWNNNPTITVKSCSEQTALAHSTSSPLYLTNTSSPTHSTATKTTSDSTGTHVVSGVARPTVPSPIAPHSIPLTAHSSASTNMEAVGRNSEAMRSDTYYESSRQPRASGELEHGAEDHFTPSSGGFRKPPHVSSSTRPIHKITPPGILARICPDGDCARLSNIVCNYICTDELCRFTLSCKKLYLLGKRLRWLRKSVLNLCLSPHTRPRFWLDLCAKLPILQAVVAKELTYLTHRTPHSSSAHSSFASTFHASSSTDHTHKSSTEATGTEHRSTAHVGLTTHTPPTAPTALPTSSSHTRRRYCPHAMGLGGAPHTDTKLGCEVFEFLVNCNLDMSKCDEILRDVNRTFPTHQLFEKRDGLGQMWMYQILHALACLNPTIGYCQGMNYLTASLLIHLLCPVASFWMALSILRHFDYLLMYSPQVILIPARVYQFSETVRRFLPELWSHLHRHTLTVDYFAHKWLPTLYAYYIDSSLLAHVWDGFFAFGWKWALRVGLAILSRLEGRLRSTNVEGMNRVIQASRFTIGEGADETKRFMHLAQSFKVTNSFLSQLSKDFHISKFSPVVDSLSHLPERSLIAFQRNSKLTEGDESIPHPGQGAVSGAKVGDGKSQRSVPEDCDGGGEGQTPAKKRYRYTLSRRVTQWH